MMYFLLLLVAIAVPFGVEAAERSIIDLPDNARVAAVQSGNGGAIVRATNGNRWRISWRQGAASFTALASQETTPRPQNILPDGRVVHGTGRIRSAWLINPTDRYDHAVLGDGIEAAGLAVRTADGRTLSLPLDAPHVFEDRYPRFADLDGDGNDELYLVRSSAKEGAGLIVVDLENGALALVAKADPIGLGHRWLNPVGAGDFDGDGRMEVAVVLMPHLGGMLVVYERRGKALVEVTFANGFSNHAMGSRFLGLSAVLDIDGDERAELIVPDNAQRVLRVMAVRDGALIEASRINLPSRLATDIAVIAGRTVLFGTRDGRAHVVRF